MIRPTLLPRLFCVFLLGAVSTTMPAQTGSSTQLPDAPSTPTHQMPPAVPSGPTVIFDTTMGRITCKFFNKEAPVAVANFIGLATGTKPYVDPTTAQKFTGKPFYYGTVFHPVS